VISAHPAVHEVGVVGLPDKMKGEIVKAFIVRRPDAKLEASELKAWCRERLAPYKVPSQFEFVSDLPKSQIGKVLRRVLRQQEPAST
jgi:long-chain acyl-CoA synthetase